MVEIGQLAAALGRFRQLPDGASERRWQDMARFLEANRRTRRDRTPFLRLEVLRPANFARLQLLGLGLLFGGGAPLILGTVTFILEWYLLRMLPQFAQVPAPGPAN